MNLDALGFHETMETHEMINFKTICLVRSKLMQGICFDNDLKALMEKDVHQSIAAIEELKELYEKARTNSDRR
ncbi:spore coat protein [Bacillus nitroreducens]